MLTYKIIVLSNSGDIIYNMKKEHIIQEIQRTAEENGGVALGRDRFEQETGIKSSCWSGKYWATWSDAVKEAGYEPNTFQQSYDEAFLLVKLIDLIREIGKFPTNAELQLKKYSDDSFPGYQAIGRLGNRNERIKRVIEYCEKNHEYMDVLEICQPLYKAEEENRESEMFIKEDLSFGFVYLMKSGKHYKIGRSNSADRRHYELKIQLPDKLDLVHKIKTDDPPGIEAYWHKRFEEKWKNGEWYELSGADVKAFKLRKFM